MYRLPYLLWGVEHVYFYVVIVIASLITNKYCFKAHMYISMHKIRYVVFAEHHWKKTKCLHCDSGSRPLHGAVSKIDLSLAVGIFLEKL